MEHTSVTGVVAGGMTHLFAEVQGSLIPLGLPVSPQGHKIPPGNASGLWIGSDHLHIRPVRVCEQSTQLYQICSRRNACTVWHSDFSGLRFGGCPNYKAWVLITVCNQKQHAVSHQACEWVQESTSSQEPSCTRHAAGGKQPCGIQTCPDCTLRISHLQGLSPAHSVSSKATCSNCDNRCWDWPIEE